MRDLIPIPRLWHDTKGVSAIEFALILPVMVVALLGGYQLTQALSAYRKTALTTRTVADLTTQYRTMTTSDMSTVLNASAQVMAPFPKANLSIVLTQYTKSLTGQATVTWSRALNGTALTAGTVVTLPTGVCQNGASIVLADVSYGFRPTVGYSIIGTINMRDTLYMSPRQIQTITYTGT